MKQGIGEWLLDNLILPIGIGLLGIVYLIRHLFRKVGL